MELTPSANPRSKNIGTVLNLYQFYYLIFAVAVAKPIKILIKLSGHAIMAVSGGNRVPIVDDGRFSLNA